MHCCPHSASWWVSIFMWRPTRATRKRFAMLPDSAYPYRDAASSLDIVVLYDPASLHTIATRAHLEAFAAHSRHRVCYAPATFGQPLGFDLHRFDVAIIHYSARVAFAGHLAPQFRAGLRAFRGLKLLFLQDD